MSEKINEAAIETTDDLTAAHVEDFEEQEGEATGEINEAVSADEARQFLESIPTREMRVAGKENRHLMVELTHERQLELSDAIADLYLDLNRLKTEKSSSMAEFNSSIKSMEGKLQKMAEAIELGKEEASVPCEWRHDYTNNTKHLVRTDTFEIIQSGPLAHYERQEEIPFDDDGEMVEQPAHIISALKRTSDLITEDDVKGVRLDLLMQKSEEAGIPEAEIVAALTTVTNREVLLWSAAAGLNNLIVELLKPGLDTGSLDMVELLKDADITPQSLATEGLSDTLQHMRLAFERTGASPTHSFINSDALTVYTILIDDVPEFEELFEKAAHILATPQEKEEAVATVVDEEMLERVAAGEQ